MSINIYNTLTRKKEEFKPMKEGHVGMYVCGPTVYDAPHIGHARSAYAFDVMRRYFAYKGYKVKFVRNVTDVDDKIINKAMQEFKGEDLNIAVKNVSDKYLKVYHDCMGKLGIMQPDREPKATEYINKMTDFIKTLIQRGTAYQAGGDVYFDVAKANGYGKLSNQSFEMLESGARIASGENKKDPMDFALWKSAKPDEPSWDSPWGKGRPGWHIECSVMSSNILGDEFDIHGGGIDLIFPHHENEIAQSEGAGKKFARYWIHNGLLTINKEKMAKSLGNFITIEGTGQARDKENESAQKEINAFKEKFEKAMDDDFNTAEALAVLFDLVTCINKNFSELYLAKDTLIELGKVLGLFESGKISGNSIDSSEKSEIENLINLRIAARKNKDFKEADKIRKELEEKGIILEDTKDGTTWRMK